jgi:hypothetical protein
VLVTVGEYRVPDRNAPPAEGPGRSRRRGVRVCYTPGGPLAEPLGGAGMP